MKIVFKSLLLSPNTILMLMPRWKIRLNVPHADDVYQGLIQGGWIGCLVTPLWVTLSMRTIKHAIHSQGNRAKQKTVRQLVHMLTLSEFKGYGNTVGILTFCAGGGTSPFHTPLLNLVLVTPAAKFLDQPLCLLYILV